MKKKPPSDSGVYKYLLSMGVLDGPPEAVERARKEYWNKVKSEWKKERKRREKAFTVSFAKDEFSVLSEAARMHGMSPTRFIKQAALAYVGKRYLVPNNTALFEVKTLLSLNYSALQELFDIGAIPVSEGMELLSRMERLEREVLELLTHPKLSRDDR